MVAIAIRTCIGCRGKFPKKTLLRFVCHLDSHLRADGLGKLPGRGTYVCESQACITEAFKSHKRVNSLLRTNLSKQIVMQFKQELLNSVIQDSRKRGDINEKTQ